MNWTKQELFDEVRRLVSVGLAGDGSSAGVLAGFERNAASIAHQISEGDVSFAEAVAWIFVECASCWGLDPERNAVISTNAVGAMTLLALEVGTAELRAATR